MQTQNTTIKHSTTAAILEESPTQGLFDLTFTNSRRHGMRPMQTHHCQGVLYSSGHVHLDTRNIVVTDFGTLSQMCLAIAPFGLARTSFTKLQRYSIAQRTTPACWVVQDKAHPKFVYFLHYRLMNEPQKRTTMVQNWCIAFW